ncbi:hypothetical protein L1987_81675 [Smallanthus sonchifolius]|uniref:Uncharacterized protein n=1 Tax=Smallanthus sonchifolius TaxID=185202 RepID=A0ACB8YVD3_9ASTR|nr:hypothetical protein L1987_81675 [Smallanthus sonchifolius]
MWIFTLLMMVLTRTRRKRCSADTRAGDQPAATEQLGTEQPAIEPAIEQLVDPPKRRGRSLNLKVNKTLQILAAGSKIPLTMDTNTKGFNGESATTFATEIGIVIHNECPMNFHKWDLVPEAVKTVMYEKLEGKIQLLQTNKVFMKFVDARLHNQWKRTRGVLSRHWKENGGKTDP